MRRRVAYSLAIVRMILVPVILLSVYYLIAMARIVDRIVSVDAPVATMAQQWRFRPYQSPTPEPRITLRPRKLLMKIERR